MVEAAILKRFSDRVRANPRSIVFPEGDDPRVLEAVLRLAADGRIGRAMFIGDRERIERAAAEKQPRADHGAPIVTAAVVVWEG